MLKRKLISLIVLVAIVMGLALITPMPVQAKAEFVLKLAHADAVDLYISRKHAQCVSFQNLVNARSGGRIDVQVFGAGSVGGEREYLESIMAGSIQAGVVSGVLGGFFPEAMITDIPYLFPSATVAWKVLDGPFGDKLSDLLLKKLRVRNLAFAEVGFRNFTNSKKEIRTPADMKGLKIRVMETPLFVNMVKGLGASPTPIAWPEVYSALQTGVVDGQENPVGVILVAKFAEVQKYLTLDGHVYGVDWFVINEDFFQSLPPDLQAIVIDSAKISSTVGRGLQQLNSTVGVGELAKKGMKVYVPTPEEKAQFKKLTQAPVIEWLKTKVDSKLIEEALMASEKASK